MRRSKLIVSCSLISILMLGGCGSNRDSGGDSTVTASGLSSSFVGSQACKTCHREIYNAFVDSGHNFKLNKVENDAVPTYPFSTIAGALAQVTDEDGVTDNSLGTPADYSEVSYVIGGYGWKARWIDTDGYIVTGSTVQYNLEDATFSAYHDDEVDKKYNCGNCHVTGWQRYDADLNANRQDDLAGMDGTWVAEGVQCESCHGPGLQHVASQDPADIVKIATARTTDDFLASDMGAGHAVACSECHTRDGEKDYPTYISAFNQAYPSASKEGGRIDASGSLIRHHEQYDELLGIDPTDVESGPLGKHLINGITCNDCHDPHKTVKYQSVTGESAVVSCESCHSDITMPADSAMVDFDCTECHMPNMVKSATSQAAEGSGPKTGDIASHIFKIDLSKDSSTEQFTEDGGGFAYPWITKTFACDTCHNGVDAEEKTIAADFVFHQATAANYVGSAECASCHLGIYNSFVESGHNFKLNKVVDNTMPTYPFSDITGALALVDDTTADEGALVDPDGVASTTDNTLGTPIDYTDVSFVIGGYGWKARWIDLNGYIVTGSAVQYNLEDGSMAGYHNNEVDKKYNCGNCHTTGWKRYDADLNANRQDNLAGMDGTFAESAIGCESCHGAGAKHVSTRQAADIVTSASPRTTAQFLADDMAYGKAVACGECHTRDGEKDYPTYESGANSAGYTGLQGGRIVSNGTTAKHHEQYDELLGLDINDDGTLGDGGALGKHLLAGVTCATCHDPHATTKHEDHVDNTSGPGVDVDCIDCHTSGVDFTVNAHDGTACTICHMPLLTKSAIWTGVNAAGRNLGDIKSHIFKIDLSKTAQLTTDNSWVYPRIIPDYACGDCHADTATRVGTLNSSHGGKIHQ